MYLPCAGSKHSKANGKRVLEVFKQCYCLYRILSMFYICMYEKIGYRYVRQPNVLIDAFSYLKFHLHEFGPFKLIKTVLKVL